MAVTHQILQNYISSVGMPRVRDDDAIGIVTSALFYMEQDAGFDHLNAVVGKVDTEAAEKGRVVQREEGAMLDLVVIGCSGVAQHPNSWRGWWRSLERSHGGLKIFLRRRSLTLSCWTRFDHYRFYNPNASLHPLTFPRIIIPIPVFLNVTDASNSMTHNKRRVSYVIPPPTEPIPRLRFPPPGVVRVGAITPNIIPHSHLARDHSPPRTASGSNPRHRLGISSLALDTSTQLTSRPSPEGILYTGGRDGMIIAWDLGMPMKKRKLKLERDAIEGRRSASGRWEMLTGWMEDGEDEDNDFDDDKFHSDGDILGEVTHSKKRRRKSVHSLPYESQWEIDMTTFKAGTQSQFRESVQANDDWVNDILLCNHNQTVISASSDGTVKAWNPHSSEQEDPTIVGTHNDYVRCLAHARDHNWVASGSFDRKIKLWDLTREHQRDPLVTLTPPDAAGPKSSVYALAADPFGRTIASGSPERVVRLWDPRTGRRIGKLVGHTDNIRALLISEDSRYLLTGSADASIKLWSLSTQRCLHTFTHHTDSVWSLFSSHPSLQSFYSGDRSGLVCRVDVENCSDLSEGECIVLCHDTDHGTTPTPLDGINKMVVMDDRLLWTASSRSSIKRWVVPPNRSARPSPNDILENKQRPRTESPVSFLRSDRGEIHFDGNNRYSTGHGSKPSLSASISSLSSSRAPSRAEGDVGGGIRSTDADTMLNGVPFRSLVRLMSPDEPFMPYLLSAKTRDVEVATIYSAASVMSAPRKSAPNSPTSPPFNRTNITTNPVRSTRTDDTTVPQRTARLEYEERELAASAMPLCDEPDNTIEGDEGLIRSIMLNDRMHALTIDTLGQVCVWDIVRGRCLGKFSCEDVAAAASVASRGSAGGSVNGSSRGAETVGGDNADRVLGPREALEVVRERIEGEAVVMPWSFIDTKIGLLTVHVSEKCFEAEIYADEVGYGQDKRFTEESKLNVGKWVLRNLFLSFIREEQRSRRSIDHGMPTDGILGPSLGRQALVPTAPLEQPKVQAPSSVEKSDSSSPPSQRPRSNSTIVYSANLIPALPPGISPTIYASPLLTPMIPLVNVAVDLHSTPSMNNDAAPLPSSQRLRSATTDGTGAAASKDAEYFASESGTTRTRQPSLPGHVPSTAVADDFSSWGVTAAKGDATAPSTPGAIGGGGLMGRLRNFGRVTSKRPSSEVTGSPILGLNASAAVSDAVGASEESYTCEPEQSVSEKFPNHEILSGPLSPPPSNESPNYTFASDLTLLISEEATPPTYRAIYRGTISSTKYDISVLERVIPTWLMEYLLLNKVPASHAPVKISFVLLPWPAKDPEQQLPELLNTSQSKLTASRYLRVRRLAIHVQEKLDKISKPTPSLSPRSSLEDSEDKDQATPARAAEDVYEVLCNDVVLPLGMTLAAVRQYVWKQSSELTMHYRRRIPSGTLPS